MRSRVAAVALLVVVAVAVGGLWLERSHGLISRELAGASQDDQARPARQRPRAERQREAAPKPGERTLAFDVERRDYRAAQHYILEITDASGTVTTHDLKKPRQRRGTISVPLPPLPSGTYQVVIIAAGAGGMSRSAPLDVKIQ